jgi:cell division protein FtsI (penicillin-binding protein 3)
VILKKDYRVRLFFVFFSFFLIYFFILFKLFIIQYYRHDFFKTAAEQQYLTHVSIRSNRACIQDRNGEKLVLNVSKPSAFILPQKLKDPEQIKKILKIYFPENFQRAFIEGKKQFCWIERLLSRQKQRWLNSLASPDIHFLYESERFYPFPSTAHVVGFNNVDNSGIAGIELEFNNFLEGTPSLFALEKDARSDNLYFKSELKEDGQSGDPVTLTLDKNLQYFASDELENAANSCGAKSGAVVIIDPTNGHILSMASFPSFDPNQINTNPAEETKNIPVTDCFEVGSVIKVLTALAALEEEVVNVNEEIDCEGKETFIDDFHVENWKSLGPGKHTFTEILARSNNVGIAKVAKRLGPKLHKHFLNLGFGSKTGIYFPGERAGFVNDPKNWSRSSIIVLSFGYEISITLLQLAKAFSIISNDGKQVRPTLIINHKKPNYNHKQEQLYRKEVVDKLKSIIKLQGWMKDSYAINGFNIFGKTGTARVIKDGEYSNKNHIYTYAGIVEKDDYKRVIITFLREPLPQYKDVLASRLTLPLFHKIAKKMVIYDMQRGTLKS